MYNIKIYKIKVEMNCSKCWGNVQITDAVDHECGHYTHYGCMPKNTKDMDFDKCFKCNNSDQVITLPIKEITSFKNRDYVLNPIQDIVYNTQFDKIFQKCDTIEDLVLGNNLHLQEMLHNGVTIDILLDNGFDWDDLVKFKDLNEPGERRIGALFALKCTAEHFHKYPNKLPIKEMNITPENLIDDFGLYFPDDCPLSTRFGNNEISWTLKDLIKLGISSQDLWDAGLVLQRQYEDLLPPIDELNKMFPSSLRLNTKQQDVHINANVYTPKVVFKKKRHGLKPKK